MRWATDIRSWIAFAFLLRLFGITNPPIEPSHSWRQATVNMVARNFSESGIDLLYPRMDTAGELSGITGMEFPLLNAIISVFITFFGAGDWYGRLVVLIISSFGVLAFHRLVRGHINPRAALYSALLLLVSLWFMYSRKVMPDVFALSLVIIGIDQLDRALSRSRYLVHLLLGMVALTLGLLSKLPAGCLLAVWPVLLITSPVPFRKKLVCSVAIITCCIPPLLWYVFWVPHLIETYGYWHFFMGGSMITGAHDLWNNLVRTLDNFYFDALRFSGFAVFILGIVQAFRAKQYALLGTLFAVGFAFFLVMLKSGDTFWIHAYYVLPFIPAMAVLGGYGLSTLADQRWAAALLVIVAIEGLAAQANDFFVSEQYTPLLTLEDDLDRITGTDDLIAINSSQVPTPMYFSHRRGWTLTNEQLLDPGALDSIATLGCKALVIMKNTYGGNIFLERPVLFERDAYRIYGMNSPM